MHGGTNPGAPKGNRNAWKHGGRSGEAREALALIRALGNLLDDSEASD
jgi:glucans biosynthesis protein